MDDLPLEKIAISGPAVASMIQRLSSSQGDVDGLLFGHVTFINPSTLSDDSSPTTQSDSPSQLVATITSFLCSGSTHSFYDSIGRVDPLALHHRISTHHHHHHHQQYLLGWFSGRRKTPLRPSMREFSVTSSLSSKSQFSFPIRNSQNPTTNLTLTPCVFLLFTTPLLDQLIHTHEYRAYQLRASTESWEPKSIDIVNIGPAFRGHYDSFSPNSLFPLLNCEMKNSAMNEDKNEGSMTKMKQVLKDQQELDMCAQGFEVGNLSRLMGSEAANYTGGLEDLYEKMLSKIDSLAKLVEKSSAKVLEQENHNRKLRYKIARSPGVE